MKTLIYTLLITLMAGCTKEKPISVSAHNNSEELQANDSLKSVSEPIKPTKRRNAEKPQQ